MPVPDFQQFMLPRLQYLRDGATRSSRERQEWLADYLQLTADERAELIPSGRLTTVSSRQQWASFYLCQGGLLQAEGRGLAALRDAERGVTINTKCLRQFPEFQVFQDRSGSASNGGIKSESGEPGPAQEAREETPEEAIEQAYRQLRSALAADLLDKIKASSPGFFEQLVVDLLVAMGYGGSRADAAQAVGGSGDGGVDGYIKEDKLGLDSIYLQAKRWEHPVGRPTVEAFAGSLEGFRAHKGVLITTSAFTPDAQDYVRRIAKTIVLIDGAQLTTLMIDHGVGVTDVAIYPVKRIDEDYFVDT